MLTLWPGYCVRYKGLGYHLPRKGRGEKTAFKFEKAMKTGWYFIFSTILWLGNFIICVNICIDHYFPSYLFCFLAQGEIEAIVVPVCLAFLLTTLLGVLFCFNKRDL